MCGRAPKALLKVRSVGDWHRVIKLTAGNILHLTYLEGFRERAIILIYAKRKIIFAF